MTRGEMEKYTMSDIDLCKWWVNLLFNMAKESAFNANIMDDAEEIQSTQDKINKLLEQEPKIDWIPVTERLPENHKNVLVSIHNYEGRQFVYIGYYASLSNTWIIEGVEYNVDAWMPLPGPYKESEG